MLTCRTGAATPNYLTETTPLSTGGRRRCIVSARRHRRRVVERSSAVPDTSERCSHWSEASSTPGAFENKLTAPNTRRPSVRRASEESLGGARCVRRLDDSLNSAIHTRYRSLLRSSSKREPRGPPLGVVNIRTDLPAEIHHHFCQRTKFNGLRKTQIHGLTHREWLRHRVGATRERLSHQRTIAHGAVEGSLTHNGVPDERCKGRREQTATIGIHPSDGNLG